MREIVRSVAVALSMGCFTASLAAFASGDALAQAKQAPPKQMAPVPAKQAAPPAQEAPIKQMALTEKQVAGVLAAQEEMDAVTEKLPENAKPNPKITAQLDGIAKKHGFASYDEYGAVMNNISLALDGFDPQTKKFVGFEAIIKAQIDQVQADQKMSAKSKKAALAELNEALKTPAPAIEHKGNIDLVAKYYDKLVEALQEEE
jgi:effector-binding domain-containing protein